MRALVLCGASAVRSCVVGHSPFVVLASCWGAKRGRVEVRCFSHQTPSQRRRDLAPPLHESPPESLRLWGVPRHLPLHSPVCSLPVHGCGAPRRDSTCVGDYRSPRGDLAIGPVHNPFISLSDRVNTYVSDFPTSLIIVGPVTIPSDRLCGVARDLFPGLLKNDPVPPWFSG